MKWNIQLETEDEKQVAALFEMMGMFKNASICPISMLDDPKQKVPKTRKKRTKAQEPQSASAEKTSPEM